MICYLNFHAWRCCYDVNLKCLGQSRVAHDYCPSHDRQRVFGRRLIVPKKNKQKPSKG